MLNTFTILVAGIELRVVHNPETLKVRWFADGQLMQVYEDTQSAQFYSWPFAEQGQDERLYIDWAHADNEALVALYRGAECVSQEIKPLAQFNPKALETANNERMQAQGIKPNGGFSWLNVGLIGFKLLKSFNVFKVALAAASLAAYSIFMSVEFAIALLGILVFHEYGHLVAMKRAGIPTKGMYLIPFVGGLAVGGLPSTRWQEVYVAMMGPVFGLLITLVFAVIYWVTDSQFAGLVTSMSALINLFNLLPVNPLDGGRVVKAILFSSKSRLAIWVALAISAVCFALSLSFGLYFLTFFVVIGVVDLLASWRQRITEDLVPLARYGVIFSLVWYFVTVAIYIALILVLGESLIGGEIAKTVLSS